uniref:Uncharacterized protein n=1 Tax=Chromera velia CCMP2878 TaxID=1169474 RepID=A0A0G4GR36_9ALVE|eukprot:Cvel_23005.t1-p1 / transcript=Cvel_23005.t1 / gene=Cvel_23005 / organism=Chromera_velia_CCMP2878 / gene_product=hypothetical protein / transcript_product=hypothetical protein / location=Cvel_scaffold2322:7522-7746(+) / protein_length=75 / sequence_SO=supercontig / SO=protein_coding / is_pseudo=false
MWKPSEVCRVEKAKIVDAVQKSEIDGNGTGAALIKEVPVPVEVDIISADFTAFLRMRKTALMTIATPIKFFGGTA